MKIPPDRNGTERNKRKIKNLQKIGTPGTKKKNTKEKITCFSFSFLLIVVWFCSFASGLIVFGLLSIVVNGLVVVVVYCSIDSTMQKQNNLKKKEKVKKEKESSDPKKSSEKQRKNASKPLPIIYLM